jgi:acyl-CoA thioesterase
MEQDSDLLLKYFRRDAFAAANGMEVIEVRPGHARARMTITDRHLNGLGILHGGAIFSLADMAFAAACNAAGHAAVAVHMSLQCMKSLAAGTLSAEAEEVARSRKISTCAVRVTSAAGELVALFQGTAYIKSEPLRLKSDPDPPSRQPTADKV